MQYRRLGKTNLNLSQIGFGGLKLDGLDQSLVNALIERAVDGGMNYIDTALNYGDSESRIGEAIHTLGLRDQVYVSSKNIHRKYDKFVAGFENTLEYLRTDCLDILYLHDVSTPEVWERVQTNGIFDYFQSLKRDGRVKHLGISTHDCGMGKILLETGVFEVAMLAYSPIARQVEDVLLPLCKQLDVGVVVMKPLGGGILCEERSKQLGFSVGAKECLTFAVSNPYVASVIPGLDRIEYVDTALSVGDTGADMTDDARDALTARISFGGQNYCRGCGYCMPCPKGIPIPTVLQLYNRWEVFGYVDWSQMHDITNEYTQKVSADRTADQCIACGACTQRCPYNLPIPDLMQDAASKLNRY